MNCKEVRNQIGELLDGELDEASAKSVQEHLESCEDCRQYREQIVQPQAMLRSVSCVKPPEGLAEKIIGRLGEDVGGGNWIETDEWCRRLVGFAAAALLVFGLLAGFWPRRNVSVQQISQRKASPVKAVQALGQNEENELMLSLAIEFGVELAVDDFSSKERSNR